MRVMLRAAAAVVAVAAYSLPLLVGSIAGLSHDMHHAVEAIRGHEGVATDSHAAPTRFVHSHGSEAHSHDSATDALLFAAEQADHDADEGVTSNIKVSSHVPARSGPARLAQSVTVVPAAPDTRAMDRVGDAPPLPPPRA